MQNELAIVYLVAGISSRFMGKIKQFARVGPNGETLIEYSLNQALPAGFTKIIFIVGNRTEKPFKEKFGDSYNGIPIHYALQLFDEQTRDKPWGTTDALCSAKQFLNCPFVVCNGDDIYGKNSFKILAEHLKNHYNSATIGYELKSVLPNEGKVNRGIFKEEDGFATDLKETFGLQMSDIEEGIYDEDTLCSMNMFALQPEVMPELQIILEKTKRENAGDRKKEALLPEDIASLIRNKKIQMKLYSTPDVWLGITNPEDEEIVRRKLEEN